MQVDQTDPYTAPLANLFKGEVGVSAEMLQVLQGIRKQHRHTDVPVKHDDNEAFQRASWYASQRLLGREVSGE
jgi:hypothetical protein